jgi:hypothetical protein
MFSTWRGTAQIHGLEEFWTEEQRSPGAFPEKMRNEPELCVKMETFTEAVERATGNEPTSDGARQPARRGDLAVEAVRQWRWPPSLILSAAGPERRPRHLPG